MQILIKLNKLNENDYILNLNVKYERPRKSSKDQYSSISNF